MGSTVVQATTTLNRRQFGVRGSTAATLIILSNDGTSNVYFDTDADASVNSAYLKPGETISIDLGANDKDAEFLSVLSSSGTNALRLWFW